MFGILSPRRPSRTHRKRRTLVTGVLAASVIIAGCSSSGGSSSSGTSVAAQKVTLTFFYYATSNQNIVPAKVISQYQAAHPNVTVKVLSGNNTSTFPGIVASEKTTGVPSVNCGYFNISSTTEGNLDNIWVPLDPKVVTNMADFPKSDVGPDNEGIEWGFTPVGLVYRKDLVNPAPTSWLDLLSPKYRGHVALIDFPLITYNGLVPINRILGGTDSDLSKGYSAYEAAAKAGQFQSVFTSTTQIQNLLQTGDATILGYAYGNVAPWIQQGMDLGYAVPKEGEIAFPIYFQILKGSTPAQVYNCEQIINQLLSPAELAQYAGLTYVAPTSTKVQLPANLADEPAYSKYAIQHALNLNWAVLAADTNENQTAWQTEVTSNMK
jgi:putative spermidine/putrescine transport system substrate-binding protein